LINNHKQTLKELEAFGFQYFICSIVFRHSVISRVMSAFYRTSFIAIGTEFNELTVGGCLQLTHVLDMSQIKEYEYMVVQTERVFVYIVVQTERVFRNIFDSPKRWLTGI
jgi:hypothetical protein